MTTGATPQLGLALPVQGELSGSWGNTVNNAITEYTNIAIAGTLTLTGDGAVTLANTTGDDLATNIGSTTAQYAIIKIAGTLTTTKIVTGPSYSKTYVVDNAATGGAVTFKAAGQTGVSVAVGEKCTVYYNGTDYVKVASSATDGVSTISFGSTGLTPSTATSGAVTVAGTLAIANGGTGTTSTTFVNLATNVTGTLPIANGGTGTSSTTFVNLATNVTGTLPIVNGGTSQSTYATGDMLYASASNTLSKRTVGTTGQVLTVSGGVPTWATPASGLPDQAGNAGKYLTTDGSTASWASTGAAAGGGIYVNNTVISTNYTIATGQNGFSVGPMTISDGYAITVSDGQRWVII